MKKTVHYSQPIPLHPFVKPACGGAGDTAIGDHLVTCVDCRRIRGTLRANEMTDEEFGRAWAKQQGIEKPRRINKRFGFHYFVDDALFSRSDPTDPFTSRMALWHDTESEAYAALGRAVRAVHLAVPTLKGES